MYKSLLLCLIVFQVLSGRSSAQSDNQIALLNPFGGEYFQGGAETEIKWESSIKGNLSIQFSSDGGLNWDTIQSNVEANRGSIKWRIPEIESSSCKVKLNSDFESDLAVFTSNFSIGNNDVLPIIRADENFKEWDIFPNLGEGKPGSNSSKLLKVINDDELLYIHFGTDSIVSLQNNNLLTLYLDTDNDPGTGKSVQGLGAEIEFRFGERLGVIYQGNKKDTIGVGPLSLIISPTVWSDRYEITIALSSISNDLKLFSSPRIRLLIKDESTGVSIPSESGGAQYQIGKYTHPPLETYSLNKISDDHIRILSHNVLFSSFFRRDRKDAYKRIYQALKPDIIGFSELYQDYKLDDVTSRLEEILPSPKGRSWKAQRTSDNVLATRFSIKYHSSAGPFGNGAFLLDLRPEFNSDLLIIVAHPACCDNDSARQDEVDAIAAFMRDVKGPGGDLTISDKTPIILMGDMNFVGDPRQVNTLIEGNIIQEDLFGKDIILDWDDTSLEDAKPFSTNLPHTFTHTGRGTPGSHSNGRLDYIIYSGSVLHLENSFVMFTPAMPVDSLSKYGVIKQDTEMASDHLPVVADFKLIYEKEESSIYASRMNDNKGIPLHKGSTETITGIVTASQEFGGDRTAFIEDGQAGIAVYGDNIENRLNTGDVVTLTGTLAHSSGLTQLILDSETVRLIPHDKGAILKPHPVTIAEIKEQEWSGREILEGKLLKIENVQILGEDRFLEDVVYKITDDKDTLEIYLDNDVNIINTLIPSQRVSIAGCLGQYKSSTPYDGGYRLYPRSLEDLEIIPDIEHLSIKELRQNDSQGIPFYSDSAKTISGIVTATNQLGRNGPAFVQDDEAGVAIYGSAYISKLSMGDSVTITGPLVVYRGMTEYVYDAEISEVIVHKKGVNPEPQLVSISDINNQEWDGIEHLEGKLVTIEDVSFLAQGKFKGYNRYQISDGDDKLDVWISNARLFGGVAIPAGKVTVVGIVGQNKSSAPYKGGYQLLPRSIEDLNISEKNEN